MDLVPDPLEVVHRDEAEECVLAARCLLLPGARVDRSLRRVRLRVEGKRGCELPGGKVVVAATCGRRLPP